MKIGIFTECYLPTLNGVVISIETFRKELEKRGHEVYVIAPHAKNFVDRDKYHIIRYPSYAFPSQPNYPQTFPLLSKGITRKIKDLNLDIIHAQHLFTMGRLGMKIGRSLNIPVVYTYHTLIAEYTHYVPIFGSMAKDIIISLSRNYCNRCDQVITQSPSMAKILKKYGVKTPIEVIPTGIDTQLLAKHFPKEVIRAKWDIPENRKILLYLSRIAKEKNIDFLLYAFTKVLKSRLEKHTLSDVHLLIVGDGPELPHYQAMVKKMGLENYVTFTGMLSNDIAVGYYGAVDIFIFPSITETQGIVVTEAMAAGAPIVAVNIMGPSDLITNSVDGYLTDLNLTQFAGKIEKLLDKPELRKAMAKNAKQNAKKFSKEKCTDKLEKLYEQTINHYHSQQKAARADQESDKFW